MIYLLVANFTVSDHIDSIWYIVECDESIITGRNLHHHYHHCILPPWESARKKKNTVFFQGTPFK